MSVEMSGFPAILECVNVWKMCGSLVSVQRRRSKRYFLLNSQEKRRAKSLELPPLHDDVYIGDIGSLVDSNVPTGVR